ncbi:MAG: hypothetical protein KDB23_16860, partial [Planctomycetales bacterium]|nr:hypothetical protein [Planctomycetales bacterium]
SSDPDLHDGKGEAYLVFAVPRVGGLQVGQSYTEEATFTLPPSVQGGYFIVETNVDPRVAETDEPTLLAQVEAIIRRAEQRLGTSLTNASPDQIRKLSRSDIIQILTGGDARPAKVYEGPYTDNNATAAESDVRDRRPDLVVESVQVPAAADSGEEITVSWTVKNQGDDATWDGTTRWTDFVFVSPDPTYIASRAKLLGSYVHVRPRELRSGETYTSERNFTLPAGIEGRYYVHVFTDVAVGRNGVVFTGYGRGQFPTWPSSYAATNWEGPSKENNGKVSEPIQVRYREPNLVIEQIQLGETVPSGGFVDLSYVVFNRGTRATRVDTWYDRVYISTDETLDFYDALVSSERHEGVLLPGESYKVETFVRVPDNIAGRFNLLVFADSPYGEGPFTKLAYPIIAGPARLQGTGQGTVLEFADEGDNVVVLPVNVTAIPAPDLQVVTVSTDARATVGEDFHLSYRVENVGGNVPDRQVEWFDRIYLSRDNQLDVYSDHFLGTFKRDQLLLSSEGYTAEFDFRLPRGITGAYYAIVVTDVVDPSRPRGVVLETNETNNTGVAAVPMLIQLPPPSDLVVSSINAPRTVQYGDPITVDWHVTNEGEVAASGRWADSVFLVDSNGVARLVGKYEPDGARRLVRGDEYGAQLTAKLPLIFPGDYQLLVRTDTFDDINEGDKNNNNVRFAEQPLSVTVPELVLGVPEEIKLGAGVSVLYSIEVPAGETLEISLDAADDFGANELFVRYEALPSSIAYDGAYEGKLAGDQRLLIPTTQAGTYYVLARSGIRDPDAPLSTATTAATLKARTLPFSITNVSLDNAGAGRYVTMTLRGAKFATDAAVRLVRPMFGEYAPVSYRVVDATRILATFDLTGAPHGLYDVQVINPDGAIAVQPYRLQVEDALPLDVAVGLGGPASLDFGEVGVYGVTIQSTTNVDIPYVYLEFGVPHVENKVPNLIPGDALRFENTLRGEPECENLTDSHLCVATLDGTGVEAEPLFADLNSTINLDGILTARGFTLDMKADGFAARSFVVDVYPEFRRLLAEDPDFLDKLSLNDLDDLAFKFGIFAAATPMTVEEYVARQTADAETIRLAILADDTAPRAFRSLAGDQQLWTEMYLAGLVATGELRAEDAPPPVRLSHKLTSDMATFAEGLLGSEVGLNVYRDGQNLVEIPGDANGDSVIDEGETVYRRSIEKFIETVRGYLGHTPDVYNGTTLFDFENYDQHLTFPTQFLTFTIQVGEEQNIESLPVEDVDLSAYFLAAGVNSAGVGLTGPQGVGDANFVPLNTALPYTIEYVHDPESTAPVRQLRILQQLDENLDERQFRLSDIEIGGMLLDLPEDRAAFTGEFDLTDTLGFALELTAGVDVTTRTATWLFRAIDPRDGLPPVDPSVGILLPGDNVTVGYIIQASQATRTGDTIDTFARVIVDDQPPRDSRQIHATIDASAPTTEFTARNVGNNTYALAWSAVDDALGAGVKDYTVYASLNGTTYTAIRRRTTDTSMEFTTPTGFAPVFLVLASDAAGNVEEAPDGLFVPPYAPAINLGHVPTADNSDPVELDVIDKPDVAATNRLFLTAKQGTPARLSTSLPPAFDSVLEPFTIAAFLQGMQQSGPSGVGALGLAFAPDSDWVYVSGGAGRNEIYRVDRTGGNADQPWVTLDVPIYDMAFDNDGRLWATTGGEGLVQLDPESGQVVRTIATGMALGMAMDAEANRMYIATTTGVQVMNLETLNLFRFSPTRVDGLAIDANGTVWGTAWPNGGQVLRFDNRGIAEIALEFE